MKLEQIHNPGVRSYFQRVAESSPSWQLVLEDEQQIYEMFFAALCEMRVHHAATNMGPWWVHEDTQPTGDEYYAARRADPDSAAFFHFLVLGDEQNFNTSVWDQEDMDEYVPTIFEMVHALKIAGLDVVRMVDDYRQTIEGQKKSFEELSNKNKSDSESLLGRPKESGNN